MDDDDYWFVRRRGPLNYGFTPISWQGWVVTAVYAAALLAIMQLAGAGRWLEWGLLFSLATLVLVIVALRTSDPERK
ncbi:hypothetical protein ACLB0R_04975 [Sphingomonas sp. GlSt437]|uniref:hypothetical protein n=1 Tax=Sphingomonas sp. GlSt437 TaxID=3389970 RepID=UPI003A88F33F